MAQYMIQAGLASGMSQTDGWHSNTPNPVPEDFDNTKFLTAKDYVPTRETRPRYKGKHEDVYGAPIIIGGWPWGDSATFGWKPEEEPDNKEGWMTCVKSGVNMIDTAPIYGSGESERLCGKWFDEMKKDGYKREDFLFQTKYSGLPTLPSNLLNWSQAPQAMMEESLKRTNLDFVDSYLVHGPIHPQSIATICKSMAELFDKRLTKMVGVANCNKDELAQYGVPLAFVQNEYSVLRRYDEVEGILEVCKENDIILQGYSALANGRLTGKWDADHEPPSTYRFSKYPMKDLEPVTNVLRKIAKERKTTMAAVSLNYCLIRGVVPVVALRNPAQAESNCKALGWRLSDEEREQIDKVSLVGRTSAIWQRG